MIRIALYQMNIKWEEKEANFRKVEEQLKKAAEQRTELLLLPEMSFTGFSMNTDLTGEKEEYTVSRMRQYSRSYQLAIGFGWVKDCGEICENHYTIVDSAGEICSDYVKIHPFSYAGEHERFRGGRELADYVLKDIPFSTVICYDLRFPEIFQIASKKAHVILVPANWPHKRRHHWKSLLSARAIENQIYLLAINCVGWMNDQYYSGDSCIISPDGKILQSISKEEGILCYDLEDDTEKYRRDFPVKEDRREELYSFFRNNQ